MRARIPVLLLMLWLLPFSGFAGTFEIRPGLTVILPELPAPWLATHQAPDGMVDHLAEHLQEDAAAKGHTLSKEAARKGALERLGKDELFLFNPQTDAHVQISFTELQKEEKEPDGGAIRMSAKYAANGVADEGWSDVEVKHLDASVKGAKYAHRFDIDYAHEGKASSFMGIVGYARPFWFWVYANDHRQAATDRQVMEMVMKEIEIRSTVPR